MSTFGIGVAVYAGYRSNHVIVSGHQGRSRLFGCSISAPLIKDAKPVFENSIVSIVRVQRHRS